jgi:hypothetical protein
MAASVPGGAIDLADRPTVGEARIAHRAVDLAEARHRLLDQPRADAGLAEIAFEDQGLRPRRTDLLRHALGPAAVLAGMDGDRCVGRGQRTGCGGANAGRSASDEEDSHPRLMPAAKPCDNRPGRRSPQQRLLYASVSLNTHQTRRNP